MNGITPATALWYASRATGVVALLMLTVVMILGIWPAALAHSIGSSADLRHGALLDFALGCAFAVAAAVTWRLVAAARALPRAQRAGALLPDRTGRVSFRGGS